MEDTNTSTSTKRSKADSSLSNISNNLDKLADIILDMGNMISGENLTKEEVIENYINEPDKLDKHTNTWDVDIHIKTRGDDIEMLNQLIELIPSDNKLLVSYVCYLKATVVEQLDKAGVKIAKEDFPLGHPKGMTWLEFENYLDTQDTVQK